LIDPENTNMVDLKQQIDEDFLPIIYSIFEKLAEIDP
jgi:hypothetical protein